MYLFPFLRELIILAGLFLPQIAFFIKDHSTRTKETSRLNKETRAPKWQMMQISDTLLMSINRSTTFLRCDCHSSRKPYGTSCAVTCHVKVAEFLQSPAV